MKNDSLFSGDTRAETSKLKKFRLQRTPETRSFFLSKVSCIHETSCCPFKHQSIPCEKWKVFADSPRAGITEFGFGIKVLFEPLSVICFSLTQSGGNYSSDRDLDQITCNCSSTFFVSSRSISYSVDHPW